MFTCKKRVRGLCNASSSLNTQLVDTHIRPFIHAIEHDKLVKVSQYKSEELQTDDTVLSDPLDIIIREKQEAHRRSLKAYNLGLVMLQDEDAELARILKLKSEIRDMEMQQEEATEQQFIAKEFDINDLLNTNISGFTCNLFLKVHSYKIILHGNGNSTLKGRYYFNDEQLELLRIKKKGKALKGSISTTVFTTNPTLEGGLYNEQSIFGKDHIFIDVDNEGQQSLHGHYLVNGTGKQKTYRASFTKETITFNYGENDGWTYIDGVGYRGLSLLKKINEN
jgi:hypothetical protein